MSRHTDWSLTLKLATSLDARIALASGESQWITGPLARNMGHRLRAKHHATIIGAQTVITDDPLLTARPGGVPVEKQPIRVVLDRRGRITPACRLFASADQSQPVFWLSASSAHSIPEHVHRIAVGEDASIRSMMNSLAQWLAELGLTTPRFFVEGGAGIATAALGENCVDHLEWFRAPLIIGADGRAALGQAGVKRLSEARKFTRTALHRLGDDVWERFARIES